MTKSLSRWLPPVLGLAAFVLVFVGLGALVGDAAARNVEMQRLVTAIEKSEAAMGKAQENVQGILQAYQAQGSLDEGSRAELDAALEAAATQGRDAIAAAAGPVSDVRWLLWHRDVKAAQEAYLAHNRAWQEYLGRAAEDPEEFAKPQDLVNSSFEEAEVEVRSAVPLVALFDLRGRVDAIFAPPPPEDSQAT